MATKVNKLSNPDFSKGPKTPQGWTWEAKDSGAKWRRDGSAPGGVTITTKKAAGTAVWSREVPCKAETFYRIEATVSCELTADDALTDPTAAGVVLSVHPLKGGKQAGDKRVTPGIHRAGEPTAIRTYYEVPEGIRRVRVAVGITAAAGTACIHHVRFIEMLEPEEVSHPLAIPAPPQAVPAPMIAKSVAVLSKTAETRPITRLLSGYFGEANVSALEPGVSIAEMRKADALLLPDAAPPPAVKTVAALLTLAKERYVVISLPAFAKLARGSLSLRRVEQDDDPTHAQIVFANYATRGFALHDVFPYAWDGDAVGSYVQNHFRRGAKLTAFCKKHGLTTLLTSMCDQDVTSDRPICLFKETSGGGLFVLDIDPAEATASTFSEPAVAMYLLLGILGQTQSSLGQYTSAVRSETEFRGFIREMQTRFEHFVVHEADEPIEDVTEQLVTIGREDQTYGLPLKSKPVILVRSGLTDGDVESAYGAFLWFKQLVRREPYICPYAQQLCSQFRLAWLPLASGWESRDGWRRSGRPPARGLSISMEDAEVAAIIDVVSTPSNTVGLVLPSHEGAYRRYIEWLPRLNASFTAGRYFAPSVEDGEDFCDRDGFAWCHAEHRVDMIIDPEIFQDDAHREVIEAGGEVVRVEVPGSDADFTARSIERTDQVATLLEHLVGLQFGLIAVNRRPAPIHFGGFPPVGSGEALIIDRRDPMLRADASQVG